MRITFGAIICVIAAPALAVAEPIEISGPHTDVDATAIQEVVLTATQGWMEHDLARATGEYANNAYFFNAFGTERNGKPAIEEFIRGVLESPGYRAGKKTPVEIRSIRFLRPDIAIVHTYWETTGQLSREGTAIGQRRSHTFRTMVKRNGRWQTDSFVVSDERNSDALAPEPAPSKTSK